MGSCEEAVILGAQEKKSSHCLSQHHYHHRLPQIVGEKTREKMTPQGQPSGKVQPLVAVSVNTALLNNSSAEGIKFH
jgi:hypothetical protein